jgi:hypothetical protein
MIIPARSDGGAGAPGACRFAPAEPPGRALILAVCAARNPREGAARVVRGNGPRPTCGLCQRPPSLAGQPGALLPPNHSHPTPRGLTQDVWQTHTPYDPERRPACNSTSPSPSPHRRGLGPPSPPPSECPAAVTRRAGQRAERAALDARRQSLHTPKHRTSFAQQQAVRPRSMRRGLPAMDRCQPRRPSSFRHHHGCARRGRQGGMGECVE